MILEFKVENTELELVNESLRLVNQSKGYISCHFDFLTSDWMDTVKIALFKNEHGEEIHTFITKTCDGVIKIPKSVLNGDYFLISVYGGDLTCTNELTIPLIRAGRQCKPDKVCCSDKDIFVDIYERLENGDSQLTSEVNRIDECLATKFNTMDFDSVFDARMELWCQDLVDMINEL